jgi:hypothetical protein
LQDDVQITRVYTRLAELGLLTPEQLFEAMKNGVLPETSEIKPTQQEYLKDRQAGLFNPLVGGVPVIAGPETNNDGTSTPNGPNPNAFDNGRPQTSTAKTFSVEEITKGFKDFNSLAKETDEQFKEKLNVKRLNVHQKQLSFNLACSVAQVSPKNEWKETIARYIEDPKLILSTDKYSNEIYKNITDLSDEFKISLEAATILYCSK